MARSFPLLVAVRRLLLPRRPEGAPIIHDGLVWKPFPVCALCGEKLDQADDKQQAARDIKREAERRHPALVDGDRPKGKSI